MKDDNDTKTIDLESYIQGLANNDGFVGYIRMSLYTPEIERQMQDIPVSKLFKEVVCSSMRDRPSLIQLLDYVRMGDIVFVDSLAHIAYDITHLINVVDALNRKGVSLTVFDSGITFSHLEQTCESPLSVIKSLAGFQRITRHETQRFGIEKAKKSGAFHGRKPSLDDSDLALLSSIVKNNKSENNVSTLAAKFNVSVSTIRRYISKFSA